MFPAGHYRVRKGDHPSQLSTVYHFSLDLWLPMESQAVTITTPPVDDEALTPQPRTNEPLSKCRCRPVYQST